MIFYYFHVIQLLCWNKNDIDLKNRVQRRETLSPMNPLNRIHSQPIQSENGMNMNKVMEDFNPKQSYSDTIANLKG